MEVKIMDEEVVDKSFFSDNFSDESKIDVRKTGMENSFNERQIGSIAIPVEPISSNCNLDYVLQMFAEQPALEAIPIEENDRVISILEKKVVEESTNSAFKRFVAKTCGEYIKDIPLSFNCSDFLEKIATKANEIALNYEVKYFIVRVNNRSFYGIVSVEKINSKLQELQLKDLEKAEEIQQNMLRKNSDTKGFPFDVCIWNKMANRVGGDYYVAKKVSDGKYFIGCFDVSGKNFSASLLTVTLGSIFSMFKMMNTENFTASKIAVALDSFLQEIVPVGNFITGTICYVDYKNSQVELINCGHTNAFVFLQDEGGKGKIAKLPPTLPPFGMGAVAQTLTASRKGIYKMPVKPGLQIDLYSDGLTDMANEDGIRYDEERTKHLFLTLFHTDVYSVAKETEKEVTNWIKNALLPDDVTMMNIRF